MNKKKNVSALDKKSHVSLIPLPSLEYHYYNTITNFIPPPPCAPLIFMMLYHSHFLKLGAATQTLLAAPVWPLYLVLGNSSLSTRDGIFCRVLLRTHGDRLEAVK